MKNLPQGLVIRFLIIGFLALVTAEIGSPADANCPSHCFNAESGFICDEDPQPVHVRCINFGSECWEVYCDEG